MTAPRPVDAALSRREELAVALFAVWCVTGLFLDGWSHQANKPETLLTPWHGLLYSGFGVATGWTMWETNRRRLAGEPRSALEDDRLATLGTILFAVGMFGDFAWHALFGIEVGVDALLSPTHLTLMTGGLLLASIPLRHRLRAGGPAGSLRDFLPVVVSTAATLAVVVFFLQYASAFHGDAAAEWLAASGLGDAAQDDVVWGVLSILVSNAVLVSVTTLLAGRWSTPFGTHAVIGGAVAVGCAGLGGFTGVELAVPVALGGLAADVAVRAGRRDLAAVAQAVVTWPLWFAVAAATVDVGWSPNPIGGALVLATLTAVFLRALQPIVVAQRAAAAPSNGAVPASTRPSTSAAAASAVAATSAG